MTQATAPHKLTTRSLRAIPIALACALVSLLCFIAPMYVIRPFRPQGSREFPFAMAVRQAGPVVSALCVVIAIGILIWAWRRTRLLSRMGLVLCLLLTIFGAWLTRFNVFEMMFHPYPSPAFAGAASTRLYKDDMLMSVTLGGETHAYPIGAMGYHHIVNDLVGGVPIAATYCTLCHTGVVWKRTLDGRVLTFRLAGIRNGNALLRDEETSSIWQQTTGLAIFGPLKGRQLELVHSDELTFALWRAEQPRGLVLLPNAQFAAQYERKGWEKYVERYPSVIDTAKTGVKPRELMLGIETFSASKAFPWKAVLSAKLIQDRVGAEPVLLLIGPDDFSVRAFRTEPDTTFVRQPDPATNQLMLDAESSSAWNFSGCAIRGPLTGHCLPPLDAKKDYWFDWRNYHPSTTIYATYSLR